MVLAGQGWAGLGRTQLELAQLRCNVFGSTIFVRGKLFLDGMGWIGLVWARLVWAEIAGLGSSELGLTRLGSALLS